MSLKDRATVVLAKKYPDVILKESVDPFAVFQSPCSRVGELQIWDDGIELTVFIGDFTHFHIGNYDDSFSKEKKEEAIVGALLLFLEKLFADEIEFFGNGRSGGQRERNQKPRGFLSKWLFGKNSWTWTGPINP